MTAWANYDDVLGQIRSLGILVDAVEVNTHKPVRCKVEGDREKRGWYWLSDIELDVADGRREWYIVGSYGVWRGNDNGAVKVALNKAARALTDEQKQAIAARHKEQAKRAAAMRQAEADRAAAEAARVWRAYVPSGRSDYLERKGVKAHGVRFDPAGRGTIAIPMQDAAGRVHGLQIIRGKDRGRKLEKEYFPRGLAKQGHYHLIGAVTPGGIVLLAEGYATAASLYEATGLPVAAAFDAGNLMPVAEALRKAYKGVRILVCADDDYLTDGNPGVTAARNAAMAVSGAVCIPEFPTDRAGRKLTDFNDLQHDPAGGQHLIRAQVEAAIQAAGWRATPTSASAPSRAEGEGDARRPAVSILSLDDAVERFVPLDDGTGKYLFDTWARRIAHRDQMLAVLPAGIRWDDVKRHPVWLNRGAYYLDQVGFDPAGEDPNCKLNTWGGWPTTPKAGRCDNLLDLLRYLCTGENNSAELFDWVIRWLAYPIQHPGAKMHSAIVVHGPQGTGKSRFFEAYASIFGEYSIVLNQGAIEDKFNSDWTSRKLFILADEIVARQDMYHLKNQLKNFITGEWVRVNPKNLAAHKERNHMNIVFLSNEKQPVILENDDRRHCVIWTPEKLEQSYYDELGEEIENGGIAALHHYLLHLDLGDFKPWTRPPMTKAKRDLIELNQDSVEAFLAEWCAGELDVPFCPCRSSHLYQAYLRWCRATGERFPRNDRQFGAHLEKMPKWFRGHKHVYASCHYTGQTKRARLVVPSDADLEHAAVKHQQKDYRRNPAKTESQWLTDCVMAFETAMNEAGGYA